MGLYKLWCHLQWEKEWGREERRKWGGEIIKEEGDNGEEEKLKESLASSRDSFNLFYYITNINVCEGRCS